MKSTLSGDRLGADAPGRLACGEVRGGNADVHAPLELPGLVGVLFSTACGGPRGGDVHYASVCGSGLLSRLCIADVCGHGETVATVGSQMYAHLQRSVDVIDDRRVLRALDRRLTSLDLRSITTAALVTYYAPGRRLTWGYAGHPPGWIYRRQAGEWSVLDGDAGTPASSTPVNLPLGTGLGGEYTRRRLVVDPGDRLVLVTDGVLEAPGSADAEFGRDGVERVLADARESSCAALADRLVSALRGHCGSEQLVHDDVTLFVGEFVPGPAGPALWHVLRNRLLRPLGLRA